MDVKELEEKLKEIDPKLSVNWVTQGIYYQTDEIAYWIYMFKDYRFNAEHLCKYLTGDQQKNFIEAIAEYSIHRGSVPDKFEQKYTDPFKELTDHLAEVLLKKNRAYGDSFTKSVDTYGLPVIGVRLSDKYNRIEHLITNDEFLENDESLQDTLLDMAGYSILALKYLKEHEDE